MHPSAAGPLAGIRILDFTTTFSGPYCTLQLAELGADVIKIEAPGGDITRSLGTSREPGMASVYIAGNHNKSSVELDLKATGSLETIHALIARADCLVHNMRPIAADKLGIGPDTALDINPQLVHAAITGYGSDGPYSGRPAYDDCIQAASGLSWLQSGVAGHPSYVASAIADKVSGQAAANAILAALLWRERTGVGQSVEVPMFETLVGFTMMEQWGGRAFVPDEGPTGYARMRSVHRRPYETSDGVISVVVYHQGHWRRFLEFIGRADILEQDRFRTVESRNRNIDELYILLEEVLAARPTADWLKILDDLDIPATTVNTTDELFDDAHLQAVEFFHEVADEEGRRYRVARPAARFSGSPLPGPNSTGAPSHLNADRAALARWLG
jgi:crotonobetainyl-CoA:carnitine CoA-transferase CaiB-like acyl-CoA transferase